MIQRVGPFLQFDAQHGPVFIAAGDIRRVVTGAQGDALLFFDDGKHEFVKHSADEVARAIAADEAQEVLQTMRERA